MTIFGELLVESHLIRKWKEVGNRGTIRYTYSRRNYRFGWRSWCMLAYFVCHLAQGRYIDHLLSVRSYVNQIGLYISSV